MTGGSSPSPSCSNGLQGARFDSSNVIRLVDNPQLIVIGEEWVRVT
jgi:hypothetical protein